MKEFKKKHEVHKEKEKSASLNLLDYGSYVFIIGMLIVIISSFFDFEGNTRQIVLGTLILFGIVIGFINVTNKEATEFLVAGMALVVLFGPFLGLISQNFTNNEVLGRFFMYLLSLIVPATIIVALKAIIITAKDE
ncbi:MAG: hypothetical protein KC589_00355 [Nanoarchaeota archaeon]|nr:hypothetical protein [Nanoarchaeota archaeon]